MPATLSTLAYWVCRRGAGELRPERLDAQPPPHRSLLRTLCTGVSTGSERLVGLGLVPASCTVMACRSMAGSFTLPVKYGYSLVGVGMAGALAGRRVFVMHPHQGLAEVADEHALPLPDDLPDRRALLIPNLETALNAVWDAELVGGEECVVLGGGTVGMLVAYVLWRTHGRAPAVVERDGERRVRLASLPWVERLLSPEQLPAGAWTVAFHATGTGAGLRTALATIGFEGRVIDLSWYGSQEVTLDLGTRFHSMRQRLIASQVSHVAPARRATCDARGRLAEVLRLLEDARLDALLGAAVPFAAMPELMARVYAGAPLSGMPVVEHA